MARFLAVPAGDTQHEHRHNSRGVLSDTSVRVQESEPALSRQPMPTRQGGSMQTTTPKQLPDEARATVYIRCAVESAFPYGSLESMKALDRGGGKASPRRSTMRGQHTSWSARRAQPAPRPPFEPGAGFQGRAPPSRDARVDHRPGSAALPQGQAAGGQALLPGSCADREPSRSGGRCRTDRGRPLVKPGAGGYAERDASLTMLERSSLPRT